MLDCNIQAVKAIPVINNPYALRQYKQYNFSVLAVNAFSGSTDVTKLKW